MADNSKPIPHVDVFALQVLNEESYRKYRAEMTPLLHEMGGGFGFDLTVAEVLKDPTGKTFNRVFSIVFESVMARDAFFADPCYSSVRAAHFEHAVGERTHLGRLVPSAPLP